MVSLVVSIECQIHGGDCHIVKVLHRTSVGYVPTDTEKYCYLCETELRKARKLAQLHKSWICPVCGIETINVNGKFTPPISTWKDQYEVAKVDKVGS
jgi:hypothetical protein